MCSGAAAVTPSEQRTSSSSCSTHPAWAWGSLAHNTPNTDLFYCAQHGKTNSSNCAHSCTQHLFFHFITWPASNPLGVRANTAATHGMCGQFPNRPCLSVWWEWVHTKVMAKAGASREAEVEWLAGMQWLGKEAVIGTGCPIRRQAGRGAGERPVEEPGVAPSARLHLGGKTKSLPGAAMEPGATLDRLSTPKRFPKGNDFREEKNACALRRRPPKQGCFKEKPPSLQLSAVLPALAAPLVPPSRLGPGRKGRDRRPFQPPVELRAAGPPLLLPGIGMSAPGTGRQPLPAAVRRARGCGEGCEEGGDAGRGVRRAAMPLVPRGPAGERLRAGTALGAPRAGPGRAGQCREARAGAAAAAMAFARWWYAMVSAGDSPGTTPVGSRDHPGSPAGATPDAPAAPRRSGWRRGWGKGVAVRLPFKIKCPSASGQVEAGCAPAVCPVRESGAGNEVLVLLAVFVVARVRQARGVMKPQQNA